MTDERFVVTASASITTLATLTQLNTATRPRPWYLYAIDGGSANAQRLEISVPGPFKGQVLHHVPIDLPTVAYTKWDLPVQIPIPRNAAVLIQGVNDAGAEVVVAHLYGSYTPIPGVPIGFMYSRRLTGTAGNNVYTTDGTTDTIPVMGGQQKLIAMTAHGAGAQLRTVNLRTSRWTTYEQAGAGYPVIPGAADVSVGAAPIKIVGDYPVSDGDVITPVGVDVSAGAYVAYAYFTVPGYSYPLE